MAFACLMYHSLSDGRFPDDQYPKYTTTRELFRSQLNGLLQSGFTLGTFADLKQQGSLPEKFCALTFDDGHRSSIELAELMSAAGVRGTFFLTMNYCRDRQDFLQPAEIRELAAAGFDLGTHGASHRALSGLPDSELREELHASRCWLEDIIGGSVQTMSLPAGQGGLKVRQAAFESGYQLIGNSVEKMNQSVELPAEINRFVVLQNHTVSKVCRIATGSPAYILQRRLRTALLALPKRAFRTYDRLRQ